MHKREARVELLGQPRRLLGHSHGRADEICGKENLPDFQLDWGQIPSLSLKSRQLRASGNLGAYCKYRAWGVAQDAFGDRAEQEFADSGSAMRPDDHQVDFVLFDDLR